MRAAEAAQEKRGLKVGDAELKVQEAQVRMLGIQARLAEVLAGRASVQALNNLNGALEHVTTITALSAPLMASMYSSLPDPAARSGRTDQDSSQSMTE